MTRIEFPGVVAIALTACALQAPAEQVPASDPGHWTMEYAVSGGIAFNVHYVRVTREGNLTAGDRRLGMDVAGRAPDDLIARLNAFLKTARDAKPAPVMPDAIGTSIVVTSSGKKRELELTPEIAAAMESAWNDALRRAIVGSWTQSGWKPCHAVAETTSLDVAIDDLSFRADGTFSVTWRGGGARTAGAPHVMLPDYSGSYTIKPELGAIHVNFPSSIAPPRDFNGDGSFQIAQDKLTLKNVWFGTRSAPQRPDVCELTFSRK